MKSDLFAQANLENEQNSSFALQNKKMLRVTVPEPVLALKGSMVAFQGNVEFHHKGAGSLGKLARRMVTNEDLPLMNVTGQGDVFFASNAAEISILQLEGDALTINGSRLLAFESMLEYDVHFNKGASMVTGGLFNTVVSGHGRVAVATVGQPVVLDCSGAPTAVDMGAAVCWSGNLTPTIRNSMNVSSMLRGGTGEAMQYVFHGPGFVVVQPFESI